MNTLLRSCVVALVLAAALPVFAGFPSLDKLKDTADKVSRSAGNVAKVGKGATGLSLEEEVAIGDAVAIEIVQRFGGLWRNVPATKRVNLVGRTLARYAQRQDLDWRFGVLASEEINAFSAPGGWVFITRGLYELVEGDDELAGVLAHEIGHIDRRHALKIIARGEMLQGISGLVAEHGKGDFTQYESAVGDIVRQLMEIGYDPNTEYDADKHGRSLAAVTGYAPGGLRRVIVKLQARAAADPTTVFSTHPSAESRLKKLPADPAPAGH